MAERAIYFGCWSHDRPGHFVFGDVASSYDYDRVSRMLGLDAKINSSLNLDGGFAPAGRQVQGAAALHHRNGWTVLAWWDRTGDSRFGSNSALIVEGTHDFASMLARLGERFPTIYARQTASIYDASHRAPADTATTSATPTGAQRHE